MTDPMRLEEQRKTITEKILNLTLEIIYLVTGEVRRILRGHLTTPLSVLIKHRPQLRGEEDFWRSHDITFISINKTQT